jgi:hypothetical protein
VWEGKCIAVLAYEQSVATCCFPPCSLAFKFSNQFAGARCLCCWRWSCSYVLQMNSRRCTMRLPPKESNKRRAFFLISVAILTTTFIAVACGSGSDDESETQGITEQSASSPMCNNSSSKTCRGRAVNSRCGWSMQEGGKTVWLDDRWCLATADAECTSGNCACDCK